MVLLNFIEVFSYFLLPWKFLRTQQQLWTRRDLPPFVPLVFGLTCNTMLALIFFSVKVMFWPWRYHWCWCYSFLYFVFIFCKYTKRKLYLISLRCCLWLWAVSEYMLSIGRIEALSHLIIPFFLHHIFTFLHLLSTLCYPQDFSESIRFKRRPLPSVDNSLPSTNLIPSYNSFCFLFWVIVGAKKTTQ